MVLGHPLGYPLREDGAAGVSPVKTAVKTMLFGFTWWLPPSSGPVVLSMPSGRTIRVTHEEGDQAYCP